MSPQWRKINLLCSLDADERVVLRRQPIPAMRPDLLALFDVAELKKYMTEEELADLPGAAAPAAAGSTDQPSANGPGTSGPGTSGPGTDGQGADSIPEGTN